MDRKRVGIRDVAEAAGVSVTTVSHVLNDTPNTRTSDETKGRVREAASRLGYQPNRIARSLRTRVSGMIGLLTEEIAATPHAGRIILGAQEAARRHNLTLAIINSPLTAGASSRRDDVKALIDRHVDGIIYATVYHRVLSLPAEMLRVPSVLIGAADKAGLIPAVVPDETAGARDVVRVLLQAGHRRIGFADGADEVPATRGRLRGYREALEEAGIAFDPALVARADAEAPGGHQAARTLLALPERPSAIFCYNDRMAMGAYRAANEAGLAIPESVSIVGFDDQAPIAGSMHPGLTTVALPHYEMGAWAVDTLVRIMETGGGTALLAERPTLLRCPVVERDSLAPPRR